MDENCYLAVDEYPDLDNHYSHMSHCLTEEAYRKMRGFETKSGFKIDYAIQIGVDNPGNMYQMSVGCVAGDEETYEAFKDFFDEVIEARHNGYKSTDEHVTDIELEPNEYCLDNGYVVSCRVRCVRNLRGLCLPPHCTRAERRKVDAVVKNACQKLSNDCKGKYVPVKNLTKENSQLLDNYKSETTSSKPLPICMSRDWPDSRSIYTSDNEDFVLHVNIKDHLRVVSLQKNGDLKSAFSRCYKNLTKLESNLKHSGFEFMKNSHLGFISTCPGNLGTGLKASVRMHIPKISKHYRIEEIFRRLKLQKQKSWVGGIESDSLVDVSNLDKLGITEVEIIKTVILGAQFLIEGEKKLEKGGNIEKEINKIKQK